MKRSLLVMGMVLAVGAPVFADTETVDGYTWTYRIDGDRAEVYSSHYRGAAIFPSPTGAVTIPQTLGGKPVMSIGIGRFTIAAA